MAEVILDMHFAQKAQQAEQAKQAQQAQQGIQSPQVAQSQQGQQGQQSTQFPRFSHGYQSIHGNVATMNSLGQAGPSNKFAPTTKDKGKSVQRVHNVANNTHGPGASSNLRTLPPPKPQSHAVRMEQQAMLLEFLKAGSLDPSVFSPAELPGKSGGLTWPRTRVEKSNEMPKGNEHPNSPLRQQVMGLVLTSTPDPTGRRESPFGSIGSKIMPPRPPIPASIRRMSPSKQSSIGSGISLPSPQVGSRNVAPGPPTGTNFPPPGLANAGNVFPTGTSFTPPGPANTSNVFASAQMDGPNNSTMAQHVSPLPAHNSAHSTHSLPIIDSNEEGTQLSVRDEIVTPMPGSSSDGNLMGGNMRYPSGPQMQAAGAVVQYQQPGNADIVHHQQPDNGTMVIRQPEVPSVGPMDYAPPSEGVQPNRSDWLNFLTREARPGLEELLYWGNMPFVETCELAQPSTHGVVQITNVSYLKD
ncbi:hypothetical protein F4677DRAFT_352519 [Hypoxylon crocopeplum]|nr:hypothetical protein F4677DRAFT_352519 [Hypoxylon crocopeplum]